MHLVRLCLGPPVSLSRCRLGGGRLGPAPPRPLRSPPCRSPMPPPGRLCPRRGCGAPLLLLGLLLALPPAAQGLPDVGLSAAQTAPQHPQKHFAPGTLKPAAHLVGDPGARDALRWRAGAGRAFLRGFALRNNSLLVPAAGLYFVYSQAVFAGRRPGPLLLAHAVLLSSARHPAAVPLLSAQASVRPGPAPWLRSVFRGAVFLLARGDRLSTSTDGVPHLLLAPSTVFFGAFAL